MKRQEKIPLLGAIFIIGFLIGWIGSFLFPKEKSQMSALSVQVIKSEEMITEKKIEERKKQYKIRIYYPYTPYSTLNQAIESFIQGQIKDFKQNMKEYPLSPLQFYTLDISYQTYTYKNYITYVFEIFLDTGGAHPNTYIHTISYNKKTDQIVTINTLIKEQPNILETLSKESRAKLMTSDKFKEANIEDIKDMIIEGTNAVEKNFRNFAFSKDGLILFFENYQVAPYVYGSFEVTIPYSTLKIDV